MASPLLKNTDTTDQMDEHGFSEPIRVLTDNGETAILQMGNDPEFTNDYSFST